MNLFVRWNQLNSLLSGLLILALLILTSCTSMNMNMTNNNSNLPSRAGGKGCTKVGLLLPDDTSSVRWETKDYPLLVQAIKAAIPRVQIDYNNDHDSSATQLTEAETDLANGDCILVVGPHDSVAAASIVAKAKAQNVPVIAYDRLIQTKDLNYYVSFDNIKVGQLQGQYIANHYQEFQKGGTPNVVVISGSQTDTNALLFSMGVHSVLDPLFASGTLKNVAETFTPDWSNSTAQAEMEADLTEQQNNIQIAYVANDGMAGGVITALQTARLSGKILVTGQDATSDGVHDILTGAQSMTVYKPIAKEAQSVGNLVKALNKGSDIKALTNGVTTLTFDGGNIPSILDTPITVDRTNISSTVIADHFLTKNDICNGLPAGTDGIC